MKQTQYEAELAKIEAAAASARQELARKRNVLDYMEGKLPDIWEHEHFVCVQHDEVCVSFKRVRYESIRGGKKDGDTPELLRRLLDQFPPMPMVKVKDGCSSFKPLVRWEREQRKRAEQGKGEQQTYDCAGVRLHVDVFQDQTVSFIWYSRAGAGEEGEILRLEVKVPWYKLALGKLDMRARYYGGHKGEKVSSWEVCELYVDHKWGAQVVKWASGGPEYPNSWEVYWDKDTGDSMRWESMFKAGE